MAQFGSGQADGSTPGAEPKREVSEARDDTSSPGSGELLAVCWSAGVPDGLGADIVNDVFDQMGQGL
jgi:hypothetical protein